MKYTNGTKLKCLISRDGDFNEGDIITILHSKKHPNSYEIKEIMNKNDGNEWGWDSSYIENTDYFEVVKITDWKSEFMEVN